MPLGLEMFMATRKSKKANDQSATTPVAYSTGFLPLDYMNGQRVQVYDDSDNIIREYDSVGFVEGTMITIIADPGLGKTTAAIQFATDIVSRFDGSFVIHEDIEQASHINRVRNITYQSPKWIKNHYAIYQDTHTENIVDRFMDHAKMKLNNRKEFEYDTGLTDMYGNPIIRLKPTVVIIDSLAMMRSEEVSFSDDSKNKDDIDQATNNMFAARVAKVNSEMFKQMLPFAKKANIIIFLINQINRKISTGFVSSPRDLVGLGENETIGGGRASLYLANNVLRFKNKGMLKPDKDYHINGHIVDAVFYKSRTNASNVSCELIFDKQKGFSPALTLCHYAINNNIIVKKGNKYIVPGHEDDPFSKYTFCEVAAHNPKILSDLYDLCLPSLQEYLGYENEHVENEQNNIDSYVSIMNMLSESYIII